MPTGAPDHGGCPLPRGQSCPLWPIRLNLKMHKNVIKFFADKLSLVKNIRIFFISWEA